MRRLIAWVALLLLLVGFYFQVSYYQTILGITLTAIASLITLDLGTTQVFRWKWRILSTIWKAWRHPQKCLFLTNININLLPGGTEPGKGYEWICGFDVISLLPWSKTLDFTLEITQPRDIEGTDGQISNIKLLGFSRNEVKPQRLPMTEEVFEFLRNRNSGIPSAFRTGYTIPINLIIQGRDHKGKSIIHETIQPDVKLFQRY
jgi:hypothetical protein